MTTPLLPHIVHIGFSAASLDIVRDEPGVHTLIVDEATCQKLDSDVLAAFADHRTVATTTEVDVACYDRELDAIGSAVAALCALNGAAAYAVGLFEHTALAAAQVRSTYGCPGTDLRAASLCRDKIEMKQAVAAAGLAVPRAWELDERTAHDVVAEIASGAEGALVMKPRNQAGSIGVRMFDGPSDLVDHVRSHSVGENMEVEEFVSGDILHLDGVVRDGAIVFFSASRYLSTCVQYEQDRVPLASVRLTAEHELASTRTYAEQVLQAVGLRDSTFHLEVFDTESGLVFLEVAARYGGAAVPAHMKSAFGVDMAAEASLACLGRPSLVGAASEGTEYATSGWLLLPVPAPGPQRVLDVTTLDEEDYGILWSRLPAVGDVLDDANGLFVAAGSFVVGADSDESLRARMRRVADDYVVSMQAAASVS